MNSSQPFWTFCLECHAAAQAQLSACGVCGSRNAWVFRQPEQWSELDTERYLRLSMLTGGLKVHFTARWIDALHRITHDLASGRISNESDYGLALYWVKLSGALDYFPPVGSRELLELIESAQKPEQQPSTALLLLREQQVVGHALSACFSEDELIYIYWRRQVEAHVDQTKFKLFGSRLGCAQGHLAHSGNRP